MKRSLVYYDSSVLRKKAQPIETITSEIKKFADDLIDTMMASNGVGLAAPQVGVLLRIFVIRDEIILPAGEFQLGEPEIFINPKISKPSQETQTASEGCLSIPGLYSDVERPLKIHVKYQNLEGKTIEEDVEGFRARVIMHENDHLNGVLFIDRIPKAERKKLEPVLREIKEKFN